VFRLIKLDGKGSKTFIGSSIDNPEDINVFWIVYGSRKVWFIRLARSYGVVDIWPVLHSRFCSRNIESSR
jgi:hypothetical protein